MRLTTFTDYSLCVFIDLAIRGLRRVASDDKWHIRHSLLLASSAGVGV